MSLNRCLVCGWLTAMMLIACAHTGGGAQRTGPPQSSCRRSEPTLADCRSACSRGETAACVEVGVAYALGIRGLPKDESAARAILEPACASG